MNKLDKKLYEIFARKELSEGCILEFKDKEGLWNKDKVTIVSNSQFATRWFSIGSKKTEVKIIGHEPTITDVFRIAEISNITFVMMNNVNIHFQKYEDGKSKDYYILYNPTLLLIEQSDETKQSLIQLFS